MRRARRSSRGITLTELLTTLALLSVAAGLSASAANALAGMTSLRAASQEIASVFSQAHELLRSLEEFDPVRWGLPPFDKLE